jgi:hypothetical protein
MKIVGLAFMAPFATLIRFLPSFQDIFSGGQPVVNVDHAETVTQNNPALAPPPRHPAPAHPPVRDARGQYARAAPPVVERPLNSFTTLPLPPAPATGRP